MKDSTSLRVKAPRESQKNTSVAQPAHNNVSQQPTGSHVASERPTRKSKTDAYTTAPWVGAAPTGNRKRSVSSTEHAVQPSKKIKNSSESAPSKSHKGASTTQKAPHRRPAKINIDSEDDEDEDEDEDSMNIDKSPQSHPHHRPATSNREAHGSNSETRSKSTDSSDDEAQDHHTDLTGLNNSSLRKKFSSEFPRWTHHSGPVKETTCQEVANSEDPADLFNNKSDHEQVDIPDPDQYETRTTASEFDGALDEPGSGDKEMKDLAELEEDSINEHKHRKNVKKVGSSKRDVARLSEVPRWEPKRAKMAKVTKNHHRRSSSQGESPLEIESSDDDSCRKPQDVNHGWAEEAHYVPVLPNARNLSIREQPLPIRRMIRAAVNHVTGNVLFDSAYPVAEKVEFETFHRDIFIKCAKHLKYSELVKRIRRDDELVKLCARVINARISNLRTRCKKITDGKVEGFYQLLAGEEAIKHVKALTNEDQDYIYPVMPNGGINTKRPFFHPCIISSIKEFFFTGSRGSLAQKYEARFSSSINEGLEKEELELPIAMVCIIATTNHASLDDWGQGYKRSKSDFRADTYEYIYRGHELFLNTLLETQPKFYHTLMSDLYKAVATKGVRSATHIANKTMARLNLPQATKTT